MSSSNESAFMVEPFDSSNYSLCSFKMKMLLLSNGLWNAISGEEAVTIAKDQQAIAAIALNLANLQLFHVIGSKTARDAWGNLTIFHRTQDMANCLWLKKKFASSQSLKNSC